MPGDKREPLTVNGSKLRISLLLVIQVIIVAFMCGVIWMDLKDDIRHLGMDRWTRTDDRIYMMQFGYLNPTVILPPHERSSLVGKDGKE